MKSVQTWNFIWSAFSLIRTEYGKILRISPYSDRMQENTDQKKLRIWTLSRSVNFRLDQVLWWLAFAYNIFEEFTESSYVNRTKKQKIQAKRNLFKILYKTSFSNALAIFSKTETKYNFSEFSFTLSQANDRFPSVLKRSENKRFPDVFRGYRDKTFTWNGLITNLKCVPEAYLEPYQASMMEDI